MCTLTPTGSTGFRSISGYGLGMAGQHPNRNIAATGVVGVFLKQINRHERRPCPPVVAGEWPRAFDDPHDEVGVPDSQRRSVHRAQVIGDVSVDVHLECRPVASEVVAGSWPGDDHVGLSSDWIEQGRMDVPVLDGCAAAQLRGEIQNVSGSKHLLKPGPFRCRQPIRRPAIGHGEEGPRCPRVKRPTGPTGTRGDTVNAGSIDKPAAGYPLSEEVAPADEYPDASGADPQAVRGFNSTHPVHLINGTATETIVKHYWVRMRNQCLGVIDEDPH